MTGAFGHIGGDRPPKPSDVVPRVEVVEYDADKGVVRHITEAITSEIEVRQGVVDRATRIAVIAELERLGYTVISPEPVCTCPETDPAERTAKYTMGQIGVGMESHAAGCPRWGMTNGGQQ